MSDCELTFPAQPNLQSLVRLIADNARSITSIHLRHEKPSMRGSMKLRPARFQYTPASLRSPGSRLGVTLTIIGIKTNARRDSRAERDFQVHTVIHTQKQTTVYLQGEGVIYKCKEIRLPHFMGETSRKETAKSRLCADPRNDELGVQERHVIRVSAQSRGKTHAKCWEGIYYIGGSGAWGG